MTTKEIPVLLLTGYLGSGKTTLVNHILSNKQGIKFAVIVNDIGEVNIDADLIQKGGIVGKKDESLVALQNGCICCTLKMDLIEQIGEILRMERFDYIVIEASGICEPEPIAQTICSIPRMGGMYTKYGVCRLDCITTVVDALRLQSEFSCGNDLTRKGIDDEDIENLIIQQIEFCNIILLNKVAEVKPEELKRIRQIIHTLQPGAEIIECNYADVDLKKIIHTGMFNFEHVATSAGWIRGIESQVTEEKLIGITTIRKMSISTKNMNISMKNMSISMKDIAIITIIIMKRAKQKNMVSALLSITAARLSTFTSSTILSLPNGAVILFAPKAYVISAITATCPTSSNKQALRSN